MSDGNVRSLRGEVVWRPPTEPVPQLVTELERLLAEAKDGELRNFVGCGLCRDGQTVTTLYAGELGRSRFTLLGGAYRMLQNLKFRLFNDEDARGVEVE